MTNPEQRDEVIYQLRKEGKTLKTVGKMFKLTRERVRQICEKQRKIELERLSTGQISEKDLTRK